MKLKLRSRIWNSYNYKEIVISFNQAQWELDTKSWTGIVWETWQNENSSFGVSDIIMNLGIIIAEASLKTLWAKWNIENLEVIRGN